MAASASFCLLAGEQLAQPAPRMKQPRPYRRFRHERDLARPRRAQLLDLAQHEGLALRNRQPVEGRFQRRPSSPPVGVVFGIGRAKRSSSARRSIARRRRNAARWWCRDRFTAIARMNVSTSTSPRNPRTARISDANTSWTTSSALAGSDSSRRASTRTRPCHRSNAAASASRRPSRSPSTIASSAGRPRPGQVRVRRASGGVRGSFTAAATSCRPSSSGTILARRSTTDVRRSARPNRTPATTARRRALGAQVQRRHRFERVRRVRGRRQSSSCSVTEVRWTGLPSRASRPRPTSLREAIDAVPSRPDECGGTQVVPATAGGPDLQRRPEQPAVGRRLMLKRRRDSVADSRHGRESPAAPRIELERRSRRRP